MPLKDQDSFAYPFSVFAGSGRVALEIEIEYSVQIIESAFIEDDHVIRRALGRGGDLPSARCST